jgi:hypothetical protein
MPIDVPRERAFAFLADLANRPAFMSRFISDFNLMRLDSSGVGAAARFRIRERGLWMETEIEEIEAPFRIIEGGRGSRLGRMPESHRWLPGTTASPPFSGPTSTRGHQKNTTRALRSSV